MSARVEEMIRRASGGEARGRGTGATEHRVEPRSKSRSRNERNQSQDDSWSPRPQFQTSKNRKGRGKDMHCQQEKGKKRVRNKRGKTKGPVSVSLTEGGACMNRRPQNSNSKENETNAEAGKAKNYRKYMKPCQFQERQGEELNPDCRLNNCDECTPENINRAAKKKEENSPNLHLSRCHTRSSVLGRAVRSCVALSGRSRFASVRQRFGFNGGVPLVALLCYWWYLR